LDLLERFEDPDKDKMSVIILQQPTLGALRMLTDDGRKAMYRYTIKANAPGSEGWDSVKLTVK
jgi:hypothetical protein